MSSRSHWEVLVNSTSFIEHSSSSSRKKNYDGSSSSSSQLPNEEPIAGPSRSTPRKGGGGKKLTEKNEQDPTWAISDSEEEDDQNAILKAANHLNSDSEDENKTTEENQQVKHLRAFQALARECQKCLKVFDNPAAASSCLNGHKCVRCYFCFHLFSNTEKLFRHFERAHRSAGRERYLMCPYCDTSIPFKSVSCHVISTHLSERPRPQRS